MARIVVQPCVQLALNELRVITTNIPTIAASLENVNKPCCPSDKCNCMQLRNQLQNIGTTVYETRGHIFGIGRELRALVDPLCF